MQEEKQNMQDDPLKEAFQNFQNSRQPDGAGEQGTDQPSNDPNKENEQQPNSESQPEQQPNNPSNQAFAEMRAKNSQLTKQQKDVETVLKTMGFNSIEEFIAKKAEEQLQQQAQKNQIPVEVEKRIQQLEQENQRFQQAQRESKVNTEISALVNKYNIEKPVFDEFVNQLRTNNINPYVSNIPLETLFIQYCPDAVWQARLAEEKKKWEAEFTKTQNAPIPTPSGHPTGSTEPNGGKKQVDWKALAAKYAK